MNGVLSLTDAEVANGHFEITQSGSLEGNGTFVKSDIGIECGRTGNLVDLTIDDSQVRLNGKGDALSSLHVVDTDSFNGKRALLAYTENTSVNSITMDSGTLLRIGTSQLYGSDKTLTVPGSINGSGTIEVNAGILTITNNTSVSSSVSIKNGIYSDKPYAGVIFNYKNGVNIPSYPDNYYLPRIEPDDVYAAEGRTTIPVVGVEIDGSKHEDGFLKGVYTDSFFSKIDLYNTEDKKPFKIDTTDENAVVDMTALVKQYGSSFLTSEYNSRVLLEVYDGTNYSFLTLDDNTPSVPVGNVERIIFIYLEHYTSNGMGGSEATTTATTHTGTGMLGSGAGSLVGGNNVFSIAGGRVPSSPTVPDKPEESKPETPVLTVTQPQEPEDVRVWSEPEAAEDTFELHIEINGTEVESVAEPVQVSIKYEPAPEAADKPIYVVFRDKNGKLVAFKAVYDSLTRRLVFKTDIAGEFVIVAFEFDGEPFSEEFYKALAVLEAVMRLSE